MEFNRTKKEVAREVELTRNEARRALRNAGEVWSGRNAIASTWRSTKNKYQRVQDSVTDRAYATDETIRENIYASVGIALGIGALAGYLLTGRSSRKKNRC